MRACVLAIATVAFAQPALARDHAHKSHQLTRHHHAHGHGFARYQRRPVRVARVRETPVISGYSMPQSFARTEATDAPFGQSAWQASQSFSAVPARGRQVARAGHDSALDAMIARHAAANGLPAELVHRVVMRESRYAPHARGAGGALGLMQIKYATARAVGYTGSAAGLLDAETNLTFAVRYLAGAYRAAGGNQGRAVALYAGGYHGRGPRLARASDWSATTMQYARVAMRQHRRGR